MKHIIKSFPQARTKIPTFLDHIYTKHLNDLGKHVEFHNNNYRNKFINHFDNSVQSLLLYIKYTKMDLKLNDTTTSINRNFDFMNPDIQGKKRLHMMNANDSFREYVMKLYDGSLSFSKADLKHAIAHYMILNYDEYIIYRFWKPFVSKYFTEKLLILKQNTCNFNREERIKDLIRNQLINNAQQNVIRKEFIRDNLPVITEKVLYHSKLGKGIYKNKFGVYKIKKDILFPMISKMSIIDIDNYPEALGTYIFKTKFHLWYIGESTKLAQRIRQHKGCLGTGEIYSYNTELAEFLKREEITDIWFYDSSRDPNMRFVYEAALQILICGELNKIGELKDRLSNNRFVQDYIEEISN